MYQFLSLNQALDQLKHYMMVRGERVQTERWQGIDLTKINNSSMVELLHVPFAFKIPESQETWKEMLRPNLPWCDNHFQERVCGYPINPGTEWANWPWGQNAKESLDDFGQFNHNYMERYWPKIAYHSAGIATDTAEEFHEEFFGQKDSAYLSAFGLRHSYGDLNNLVNLLANEPDTRQAYFPVWFPEDTGDIHNGRKPCTIGYHFILRKDKLDITYHIRSCDYARHFRDDVYLTLLLGQWILEQLRKQHSVWERVSLGRMVMNITSLHMFESDYTMMYRQLPQG